MEKWYLSDNGQVSGPFSIDDVQGLIANNSDLYGWNPSYSHWLPVIKIQEFSEFLVHEKPPEQVSKALVDKFVTKKRELKKKALLIDSSVEATLQTMSYFESEINKYRELTSSLSDEVKENIAPLEKKYKSISNKLDDLQRAVVISKQEISDVSQEFSEFVLNKSSENNEEQAKSIPVAVTAAKTSPLVEEVPQALATEKTTSSVVPIRNVVKETKPNENTQQNAPSLKSRSTQDKGTAELSAEALAAEKKSFKDKLKSVFAKHNEEPATASFSERMLKLEKDDDSAEEVVVGNVEDVVFLDYETEANSLDESEPKRRHRRRRQLVGHQNI